MNDNIMNELQQAINNINDQQAGIDLVPEITELSKDNLIFQYKDFGLKIELLQIREERNYDIIAEVVVQVSKQHYPNIRNETIYRTKLNLISIQTKTKFVNEMNRILPPIEWKDVVENITEETLHRFRKGNEIITVGSMPVDKAPSYVAFPLVRNDGLNWLFGQGAQGKSYISTFIGMLVQSGLDHAGLTTEQGNVLYLDWEDRKGTMNTRVAALRKGNNESLSNIDHVEMSGTTLGSSISNIKKWINEKDYSFIVIDSFGMAIGGDQNLQNVVTPVCDSLNDLKTPVLIIDHVSKENGDTPIGSSYKFASARNIWKIDKSQNVGANIIEVGLYHTKANNSKLFPPIGIRMEFINDMYDQTDRVVISPIDVGDNDVLADALPVTRKIERELEESPKTVEQLVQNTGSNINTVRTTLSRYNNKFERMERNTYRLNPTYYKGGSNA
jgi:hypothetical protein